MSGITRLTSVAILLSALGFSGLCEADAADQKPAVIRIASHTDAAQPAQVPALIQNFSGAKPIHAAKSVQAQPTGYHHYGHHHHRPPFTPSSVRGGCYPQLNAPMYPCPQPMTPTYVGGSMITNQAFAPHEMLYPHTYRAMYPPFYHKVKGSWYLTPFGVRSHDRWKLQGTEVIVKYRSHYKPFSLFAPPSAHTRSHH